MFKRVLCGVTFLLLSFAASAAAQEITSPYEFIDERQTVGAFAGYVATGSGTLDNGPESAPVFGARYGIRVAGPFMIEGEVGFVPSSRTVLALVDSVVTVRGETDLNILLIQGVLRFNLTGPRTFHGIQPFLLFGGGGAIEVGGDDAADEGLGTTQVFDFGTTFAGHVGGGVEWVTAGPLSLRADARLQLWEIENPFDFTVADPSVPQQEWTQNFLLSAAVSYRF